MDDDAPPSSAGGDRAFVDQIGRSVQRKLTAKGQEGNPLWAGLGMAGLVGWSVCVPTLLGVMLGVWVDRHHPGRHSWTLALLVAGLVLGCANAWRWLSHQAAGLDHDGRPPHA
jgi:ATP synthase protein I